MPIALLPKSVSSAVKTEQVRLLFHQGATVQLLGILTGIVSVAMLWPVANSALLALWLSVLVGFSVLRLWATLKFNRTESSDKARVIRWGRVYVVGAFISGVIWGALSLFFDPTWPASYQVVLFVIYTGITAGAFNTHSSYFWAFPAFYLPPVLCLISVMLSHGGEGFYALAALFCIYIVLMYVSALKFHDRLVVALEVRFENEALAAELAHSNQQLTRLAEQDPLTGLHNRRSMDAFLAKEWARHYRNGRPLSLLFIDLDFFKQYNDTYGHDAGDSCLERVAKVLRAHARRAGDMAARFGGEEFALILPETDAEHAQALARTLLEDLERENIPHASSTISDRVSMSIGVATMVPSQPHGDGLMRLVADRALYEAKRSGRNGVVAADDVDTRGQPI